MNILLSPDSFKGTLTSSEVCDIIESALRNRIPDCNVIKLPAADGGEGLCSSFANSNDGEWISADAKDPFGLSSRADMKIDGKACTLFAGGGLITDSVEEQEWLETEAKMGTMLQCFNYSINHNQPL